MSRVRSFEQTLLFPTDFVHCQRFCSRSIKSVFFVYADYGSQRTMKTSKVCSDCSEWRETPFFENKVCPELRRHPPPLVDGYRVIRAN